MKLDMNNFKTGRTLVLYRAMEYRTMELKWSVVTKHETIKERVKVSIKKYPIFLFFDFKYLTVTDKKIYSS